MAVSEKIANILATLPDRPGCYLMKDREDQLLYVGKAVNLKNRVRSYFHSPGQQTQKTRRMVSLIDHIEWIVVDSELEALILEMNLIKKNRPPFNVQLKDDKRYPYIKISFQDPYPKISVTRQLESDGARYFGPYTSVWAVNQTLDLLRRIFPYHTCDRDLTGADQRACLYYDIKLCPAPCTGKISRDDYRASMENIASFLSGDTDEIIDSLTAKMNDDAEALRYEAAAIRRDQIRAIERVVERQRIVTTDELNSDVLAMARIENEACVQVFFIRKGKLIGQDYFIMNETEDENDEEILSGFIKQFYSKSVNVPDRMYLPIEIEERRIIQQWLRQDRRNPKVQLQVPKSGNPKELVSMATENAIETLRALKTQWANDTHKQSQSLAELETALELPRTPNRIECYDISNTQGTLSVGSMVVFEQGIPRKAHYRRFNIKTVEGPNDFESMTEVLTRRLKRWQSAQEKDNRTGGRIDESFALLPDLIIMDGGKGQLGRAVEVLREFDLFGRISVVGLAKREEELFRPFESDPILLPRRSEGLYLVQRVRDEAHRFAITAHRNRRTRSGLTSELEKIPGIGPVKRKALMKKFGSTEGIAKATAFELTRVSGITQSNADAIRAYFGGE
ncbi:excinuclease ABC subunit C [Anaerolineaceae bacterium oral taxon 439]|nr:excinuclease ABC subunit C [Anaerolineaceae bacterium oral taxon 439]